MSIELANRIEYFLSRATPARSGQGGSGIGVASGRGPREENQDRAVVAHLSLPGPTNLLVGLVCDGMGGMAQGGEAAECAASVFLARLAESRLSSLPGRLREAIAAANKNVYRRFGGRGGTTLTALVAGLDTNETWAAHAGDSRLYRFGRDASFSLITRDDTIGGQLNPISQNDDILDNRLLQFVGIGAQLEPHILRVSEANASKFLLTSDGAHSIGRRSLEGVLTSSSSAAEMVRKITYIAEAVGVDDNASAVVISLADLELLPPFGSGFEITLWTGNDSLEIWLDALPERLNEDQVSTQTPRPVVPKQKKNPRGRTKANNKKPTLKNDDKPDQADRPQLNIEFGPKDEDGK